MKNGLLLVNQFYTVSVENEWIFLIKKNISPIFMLICYRDIVLSLVTDCTYKPCHMLQGITKVC